MDRKEMISFLYTQLGKQGLTDLVNQGKISALEYREIVGEDCIVSLETLKTVLREQVRAYKWVKAEQPFLYDGYMQCNSQNDKEMMRDCMDALQLGLETSIEWKLPDETRKTITDPVYFLTMKATSTRITQVCFGIEEAIVLEIEALTDETVKDYNVESRFNALYEQIMNPQPEVDEEEKVEEDTVVKEEETETEIVE